MRDGVAVAGLLILSAGCGWAWPPLGPIVLGGVMLGVAVLGHLREAPPPPENTDNEPPR